ncbi:hypothetical protein DXG01_003031 [Tephrocybe rancida]|nr:hypothetical protein DXG01_003031 [Tephrocybe rancida]
MKDRRTKHKHTDSNFLMGRRILYDDNNKACQWKWALEDYRKKHHDSINEKAREQSAKLHSDARSLSVEEQQVWRLKQLAYAQKYHEWYASKLL